MSQSYFNYSPLDASIDCIRLAALEPSGDFGDPVCCQLVHTAFGDTPKYEALSYTWGDEAPRNSIVIDGKAFLVRKNLRDALIQLRLPFKKRLLWIDAICINQDDILERNQQVRIMPHIYSRAWMVLVWLGSINDQEHGNRAATEIEYYSLGVYFGNFLDEMIAADYWNRVWIVQEIGKAQEITIHYGPEEMGWEDFIDRIRTRRRTSIYRESCRPVMLADQMSNKYDYGYKLENLLKTHQQALCKDLRDKIYGFVGLAYDTYGRLTVDYKKTPFEVWKDVVMFRNADKKSSQYDILQFSRFVMELLGGQLIGTTNDILKEKHQVSFQSKPEDGLVLCPAHLWDRIALVGPSYIEMRSCLRKVDEWTASIRDHVRDEYLRYALEENDLILRQLEIVNDVDLDLVSCIHNPYRYSFHHNEGAGVGRLHNVTPIVPECTEELMDTTSTNEIRSGGKHLILLDFCPSEHTSEMESRRRFRGIGLAPATARRGDFFYYFHKKERAALVRKTKMCTSIIGTAAIPFVGAMPNHILGIKKSEWAVEEETESKFVVMNNAELKDTETINIYMDLGSVYEWSSKDQ